MHHKYPGLFALIDGFILAFHGTSKQRTKKGIGLTISGIFLVLLSWLGILCLGFNPSLTGSVSALLANFAGQLAGIIVGIILLVVCGLPLLCVALSLLFITIGSFVTLFKPKENDEGKPLSAYLVNQIGLILIVALIVILVI